LFTDVIVMMKLFSFVHVNGHMRRIIQTVQIAKEVHIDGHGFYRQFIGDMIITDDDLKIIIDNSDIPTKLISLKHYFYFICCPTLCYQMNYPRNKRIRKMFILKRLCELFLVAIVFL